VSVWNQFQTQEKMFLSFLGKNKKGDNEMVSHLRDFVWHKRRLRVKIGKRKNIAVHYWLFVWQICVNYSTITFFFVALFHSFFSKIGFGNLKNLANPGFWKNCCLQIWRKTMSKLVYVDNLTFWRLNETSERFRDNRKQRARKH